MEGQLFEQNKQLHNEEVVMTTQYLDLKINVHQIDPHFNTNHQ